MIFIIWGIVTVLPFVIEIIREKRSSEYESG